MLHQNILSQIKRIQLSCFLHLNIISLVVISLILFLTNINSYAAQVDLEWDPNSESYLAGYKVYYGNSSGSYDGNIDVGNQTSYTVTDLVEGETKYFALTAYDMSDSESNYSNEVVYYVPILDLTVPSNGIMDNDTQWTSSTGSWHVSSGTNPYGANSLYSNTSTTYTYEASGVNGEKEVSLWWTYWSNRCTSVPVDIYDGAQLLATVNVNHQANVDQWNSLGTYTFNSGTARVVVNSQGGCTTNADAVRIEGLAPPPTPPSTPTSLQATVIANTKMNLSWNASTDNVGVTGYKIYRDGIQVADVSSTTYQDTGLNENTTYVYTVSAYDAAGNESSQSTPLTANTKSPGSPTGMKIVST